MIKILAIFTLFFTACSVHNNKEITQSLQTDEHALPTEESHVIVEQSTILTSEQRKKFLMGNTDYSKNETFTKILQGQYAIQDIWLPKEVWEAFLAMTKHAQSEGVTLKLLSGARNYDHQVRVWNRRWQTNVSQLQATKDNLAFIAMPTTSRHHWGTEIDFWGISNNLSAGKKQYQWLRKNANSYGFYQVYTSKEEEPSRTGYREEKWHWSYLPLSCGYLTEYNALITNEDITGFKGDQFVEKLDIVGNYVNGVTQTAKDCSKHLTNPFKSFNSI